MTTETTTTAPDTTQAATGTEAAATTEGTTVLGAAGTTAGDVDADTGAETGAAGEKPAGSEAKAKEGSEDDKPQGAPEKYEFTMPEGMVLDEALSSQVEPVLRELNLTNEQANKLASTFAAHRASEAQRQHDAYAQQVDDWGKAARDDKEYGGTAFDENVKLAQKAIGAYGTPELKALLNDGFGNHPELIRVFVRVGKAMQEDSGVDPGNRTPATKSSAAVLFDHPTSQSKR